MIAKKSTSVSGLCTRYQAGSGPIGFGGNPMAVSRGAVPGGAWCASLFDQCSEKTLPRRTHGVHPYAAIGSEGGAGGGLEKPPVRIGKSGPRSLEARRFISGARERAIMKPEIMLLSIAWHFSGRWTGCSCRHPPWDFAGHYRREHRQRKAIETGVCSSLARLSRSEADASWSDAELSTPMPNQNREKALM